MPKPNAISIFLDEQQRARLLKNAVAAGYPTVETYLLHLGEAESPYIAHFKKLMEQFAVVDKEREFTAATLYGPEWATLDVGVRINVGKLFSAALKTGMIKATVVRITSSNHSIYRKA